MPKSLKKIGYLAEAEKSQKSYQYKPPNRPAQVQRQPKSIEGQRPLFGEVPIDHLQPKKTK